MNIANASRPPTAFVTFSGDSTKHVRTVINMVHCLERNGIRTTMDMFHYNMPTTDKIGWIRRMYTESEFIIVCISTQYMIQANPLVTPDTVNGNGLHTSLIYRMMQTESESTNSDHRFLPVLIGDSSVNDIPELLRSCPCFRWPTQYSEVLSYILIPEYRTKVEEYVHVITLDSRPSRA